MNNTLAVLKLVSKFCAKHDCRPMMQNIMVKPVYSEGNVTLYATAGYTAIRATIGIDNYIAPLWEQITCESIEKAVKVDDLDLLRQPDFEINFPSFDKVFNRRDFVSTLTAGFNTKLMLGIFQALEGFRKDLKVKLGRIEFQELSADSSNFMTWIINEGLQSQIKIEIAVMPLRG